MKHVTVGKAIDWQQWQLDQSVRSIRMQVDRDNDLYALPVVIIDPTYPSVRVSTASVTRVERAVTAVPVTVWIPANESLDAYCLGIAIDYADGTTALDRFVDIGFAQRETGTLRWLHRYWCTTVPTFRPSYVVNFAYPGIRFGDGINVTPVPAFTGGAIVAMLWGYDA